ncbi:MAG TPA: TonB-dependent receptor [Bacteroidales bacterium]|nr:TonB-dependent receptor [Bacteroidales bacterium]
MKTILHEKCCSWTVFSFFLLFGLLFTLNGQGDARFIIQGKLTDRQSHEPVIFATIAISHLPDSVFLTGVSGDYEGNFTAGPLAAGNYRLRISALGYQPFIVEVNLVSDSNMGEIILQQQIAILEEVIVSGERIKAKKEADRTVFFTNEKLNGVSATGTDLLGYIPGIQIDLMKNISVNGKSDIIIQVDGKDRDKNYVSRISPEDIDRVEILNSPGPEYDATVSGVINIVMKERTGDGLNGNISVEVPVLKSIIYSHPSISTSYIKGNAELFASYTGSFSYFDITESGYRKVENSSGKTEITANQFVRQKDWSNIFHLGFDYRMNKNNQLSLYTYLNPFSAEFDGSAEYLIKDREGENGLKLQKDDSDKNLNTHYSLWYSHAFAKPGSELSFEFNFSSFRASNGTDYKYIGADREILSRFSSLTRPLQNSGSIKLDYSIPFSEKFRLDAGIKARLQNMKDRQPAGFMYEEDVAAGWSSLTFTSDKNSLIAGLRAEKSGTGIKDSSLYSGMAVLPRLSLTRKLTARQSLEFSYNSTLRRPNIYELNPYYSNTDPFSAVIGNPGIKGEITRRLSLTWSGSAGDSFLSAGLFYEKESNSISRYAVVKDSGFVESGIGNLGALSRYGIQFSGPLKLNRIITITPWIRFFNSYTSANSFAQANHVSSRNKIALESGLSAIATFRHEFSVSFQLQYNSPYIDMQSEYCSDPLWMLSSEKTLLKKFRAGVVTALPFTRSFAYHGNKTYAEGLYIRTEGDLQLPLIPFWFKLSYQFNSGEKRARNTHEKEDIINVPRKGF